MDVSFILSMDELYTLMLLAPKISENGRRFINEALADAEICDLSGLVEKSLARRIEDELDLEPVLRLVADALSNADNAQLIGEVWSIRSPWVSLLCERYTYHENHWKITPVKEAYKHENKH
jgi:hypothetical protein